MCTATYGPHAVWIGQIVFRSECYRIQTFNSIVYFQLCGNSLGNMCVIIRCPQIFISFQAPECGEETELQHPSTTAHHMLM